MLDTMPVAHPEPIAPAADPAPRRRQWGAEKRSEPMSIVHPKPTGRKIVLGRLGIITTVTAWIVYVVTTILRQFADNPGAGFRFQLEAASYLTVVTFLTFSALMYLLARQGALYRFRDHQRVPRGELDRHFARYDGGVTVLVPSYAEEPEIVRATLWSAALQEFPDLRVVLLLDDPPFPSEPAVVQRLERTRALQAEISDRLAAPAGRARAALAAFRSGDHAPSSDLQRLISEYGAAAIWLEEFAEAERIEDHVDEFFVDLVVMGLARELRLVLLALEAAAAQSAELAPERIEELHLRLVRTFSVKTETFERKRYANLSHEANKAMNLNSYIGLMGGSYSEEATARGPLLVPTTQADADLVVPDTDYVLTLDADSVLLPEYCLRLVYLLEQPEYEGVAVAQTPYSAFPGATTRIERIAGATTDIQHIVHQGLTHHRATFWVGANAVLRKRALDEIATVERIGGKSIRRYVQDRTVIEDTESTIDLALGGWSLYNYPERLSYSATPPDFGSLSIQRQRWANGGLLILGKLRRYASVRRSRSVRGRGLTELFLRVNYLASISWSSLGLIVLLVYPINAALLTPIALATHFPTSPRCRAT